MAISDMWIRVLGQSMFNIPAFVMLGLVTIWLANGKPAGHKALLYHASFVCFVRVVSAMSSAVNIYYHGRSTQNWMFMMSEVTILVFAIHFCHERFKLRTTLGRTETANFLDVERKLSCLSTERLDSFQLNEGLKEAQQLHTAQQALDSE